LNISTDSVGAAWMLDTHNGIVWHNAAARATIILTSVSTLTS
jgi:hypothetical protein